MWHVYSVIASRVIGEQNDRQIAVVRQNNGNNYWYKLCFLRLKPLDRVTCMSSITEGRLWYLNLSVWLNATITHLVNMIKVYK